MIFVLLCFVFCMLHGFFSLDVGKMIVKLASVRERSLVIFILFVILHGHMIARALTQNHTQAYTVTLLVFFAHFV